MKKVIVIYGKPDDAAAFDRHYQTVHVPLVLKMPHLRGFEYSIGDVGSSDESAVHHLVAVLTYDNQDDLDASLGSLEGQAAVADVGNFASGGVEIINTEMTTAG